MTKDHTLSGLAYLSVIFAPIIFPAIVWISVKDQGVKADAKKAVFLHLLPGVSSFFIVGVLTNLGTLCNQQAVFSNGAAIGLAVWLLINLSVTGYTVILGIKEIFS
ncbi:hypothetical protein [Levilactobacillus enshiensis]|uniref:hypothetical protein n=1 Tax=Levilactobacillus enshiensis TaxID=2590213 RepID=UPI00117B1E11|nr:hypothetical protein [Levilactobacillus enshiensis]